MVWERLLPLEGEEGVLVLAEEEGLGEEVLHLQEDLHQRLVERQKQEEGRQRQGVVLQRQEAELRRQGVVLQKREAEPQRQGVVELQRLEGVVPPTQGEVAGKQEEVEQRRQGEVEEQRQEEVGQKRQEEEVLMRQGEEVQKLQEEEVLMQPGEEVQQQEVEGLRQEVEEWDSLARVNLKMMYWPSFLLRVENWVVEEKLDWKPVQSQQIQLRGHCIFVVPNGSSGPPAFRDLV